MWEHLEKAIAYLLPGFVAYILIFKPLTGAREESELRATVMSLLWSLPIAATASAYAAWRAYDVDWNRSATQFWLLVMAVASGTLIGLAERNIGLSQKVWRLFGREISKYPTVWQSMFDFRKEGGGVVFIRMSDGSTYYGALVQATEVPGEDAPEILLEDTYFFPKPERPDDQPKWMRIGRPVYISMSAVAAVERGMSGDEIDKEDLTPYV